MESSSAEQAKGNKAKREVATSTEEDKETCERKISVKNTRMNDKNNNKKSSKQEAKEGNAKADREGQQVTDGGEAIKEETNVLDMNEQNNPIDKSTTVELAKKEDDVDESNSVQEEDSSGSAVMTEASFESLGLCEPLAKACAMAGWKTATRIQNEVLPYALKGRDIIGLAETGSGKTGELSRMQNVRSPHAIFNPFHSSNFNVCLLPKYDTPTLSLQRNNQH
jgi:DEAD/DEAH box helicase